MFENGHMTRPWVLFFEQLSGGGVGGGGGEALDVDLDDGPGSTAISSLTDATAGAVLGVTITQSAVGGRAVTWSSQFAAGTGTDILMEANEVTKKLFIGKLDGKWHEFSTFAG